MAPKNATKQKAAKAEPTDKVPPKKAAPKKKEPAKFIPLAPVGSQVCPIDVNIEGDKLESKQDKGGDFMHSIQLRAGASFSLVKTIVPENGPFANHQIIILRPAKPFPFLKLDKEVRVRVYRCYLANKGVLNEPIVVDGKRKDSKALYAQSYANKMKNRLGLLAVNREVHDEATPIFYATLICIENTASILEFCTSIPGSARSLLQYVDVKQYVRTSSRNAMSLLAECINLKKLTIQSGVNSVESNPAKAARAFCQDAHKFLDEFGKLKGKKDAGVDLLVFGKEAFKYKDDKKRDKKYTVDMVDDFKDELRAKLTGVPNS